MFLFQKSLFVIHSLFFHKKYLSLSKTWFFIFDYFHTILLKKINSRKEYKTLTIKTNKKHIYLIKYSCA